MASKDFETLLQTAIEKLEQQKEKTYVGTNWNHQLQKLEERILQTEAKNAALSLQLENALNRIKTLEAKLEVTSLTGMRVIVHSILFFFFLNNFIFHQ